MNGSRFRIQCWIYWMCLLFLRTGMCDQCLSGNEFVCKDKTISEPGTVRFAALVNMHYPDYFRKQCGDISAEGFQTALAVHWITKLLNKNDYIPGITLGFDIYDDCGLPSRATVSTIDFLPHGKPPELVSCYGSNATKPPLAGVIGVTSQEAMTTTMTVVTKDTPIISGIARSAMLENYPNLFFTVPKQTEHIEAVFNLLEKLQWYYITVVYTDEAEGLSLYETFKNASKSTHVCLGLWKRIYVKDGQSSAMVESQIKTLVDDLESEQTRNVAGGKMGVIYLGSASIANLIIQLAMEEKSNQARDLQWLILTNVKTNALLLRTLESQSADLSIITSSIQDDVIFDEFRDFVLNILANGYVERYQPWISKYMKKIYPECAQTTSSCTRSELEARFKQDEYSYSAILGTITLASAIKLIHKERCNGQAGYCSEMEAIDLENEVSKKLQSMQADSLSMNTTLKELQNHTIISSGKRIALDGKAGTNFYKYDKDTRDFKKNGVYNQGKDLTLTNGQISPSQCKSKCSVCENVDDVTFSYIHGDILLLGLFSIREPSDTNKYKCGDLRHDDQSMVTVLAFREAIKSLGTIEGKTVGGLALDDCYNPLYITDLLGELFSKERLLTDPKTNHVVDITKVRIVIGGLSSDVTIAVTNMMTKLHIPVISYGASSVFLDNRRMFPYFSRTVPSDKLQTDGMVELLKTLSFTFVGAVYSDGAYGYNGIKDVEEKAEVTGICVDTLHKVTDKFQRFREIEEDLEKNVVKVVVFFGIDTIAKEMLNAFSEPFIFIASESWGRNTHLLVKNARGSLVFETDTGFDITNEQFRNYLRGITPESTMDIPWIGHFWEAQFQCYFPWSYNILSGSTPCNSSANLSPTVVDKLQTLQRIIHMNYAVQASWIGCNSSKCTNTQTLSSASAQNLANAIRKSELSGKRPFNDDGNGFMGLNIFNIRVTGDDKYEYVEVGSYETVKGLSLSREKLSFYNNIGQVVDASKVDATCQERLCGNICTDDTQPQTTTTAATLTGTTLAVVTTTKDTTITTVTIALAIIVGIVVIVVILLIVLLFRQHKTNKEIARDKSTSGSHHISTQNIYDEVRTIQGTSNPIFPPHSSSSGIGGGSSAGSNSTARRIPVQYTDIRHSNPDLTNAKIPDRVRSHMSQSLSSLTGSVDNNSNGTSSLQRRRPQPSPLAVPNRLSPSDKLTYISAEDLGIEDEEEVATYNRNYLELSAGAESTLSKPSDNQSMNSNYTQNPQHSGENVMLDNSQNLVYFQNNQQRPATLPGIKSLNPQLPSNQRLSAQANPHITSQIPQQNHIPQSHTGSAMYLHPVSSQPSQIPLVQRAISQPQMPFTDQTMNYTNNFTQQLSVPMNHRADSYPQLYLQPLVNNNSIQNGHLQQESYYPTQFVDQNGVVYQEHPMPVDSNFVISQPNIMGLTDPGPQLVTSRPADIHIVHSHSHPAPVTGNNTFDTRHPYEQRQDAPVINRRLNLTAPRIVNSKGENLVHRPVTNIQEEEEFII